MSIENMDKYILKAKAGDNTSTLTLERIEASAGVGSTSVGTSAGSPRQAKRAEILDTAKDYVTRDRQQTHGELEDSFGRTAKLWSAHLGHDVSAVDVTIMMALLKIARLGSAPDHADNWVDLAGYAACGGELALGEKK